MRPGPAGRHRAPRGTAPDPAAAAARRRWSTTILDVAAGLADRARADGLDPVAVGRRGARGGRRGRPASRSGRRTSASATYRCGICVGDAARTARGARPRRARRRARRGPPRRRARPAARALHRDRHRHRGGATSSTAGRSPARTARPARSGTSWCGPAAALRVRRARLPGGDGVGLRRSAGGTPNCPAIAGVTALRRGHPGRGRRGAGQPRSGARPSRRWPTGCSPPRRSTTRASWCSAAAWPRPARPCSSPLRAALRRPGHVPPDAADRPRRARRQRRLPRRRPAGPRPPGESPSDRAVSGRIVRPGAVVPGHVEVDGADDRRRSPADAHAGDDVIVPGLRRPALPRRRRAHLHHRRRRTRPAAPPRSTCGTAPPRCWPAWSAPRTS